MKLTVSIMGENAAFEDGQEGRSEFARILRALADRLEDDFGGTFDAPLFDANGNRVGRCEIDPYLG